jgi:hypothetical protein
MSELAKRAVACKHWRWMPGMLAGCGGRRLRSRRSGRPPYRGALPDLTDPATLGCLLALVREAWGDPYVYAMRLNVRRQIWVVHVPSDRHSIHGEGETESKALVAALEAAP